MNKFMNILILLTLVLNPYFFLLKTIILEKQGSKSKINV